MAARFNLEADFNSETEEIEKHDIDTFSNFHIILPMVGGFAGKNIIAFEIHRPQSDPSSNDVVFDATGVFGVNECSILVNSYSIVGGNPEDNVKFAPLFDLNPFTSLDDEYSQRTSVEWKIENLEKTKFNSFGIHALNEISDYGFTLSVPEITRAYDPLIDIDSTILKSRQRTTWYTPLNRNGYEQLRFETKDSNNN